jgi:hypothetical protein
MGAVERVARGVVGTATLLPAMTFAIPAFAIGLALVEASPLAIPSAT